MERVNKPMIWTGIVSCWVFFLLEFVFDFGLGTLVPGYDWLVKSISYLGHSGSPAEEWFTLWGLLFAILITFFVIAFYQTYKGRKWVGLATFFLILYALGEGIGSGFFPINSPGTPVTLVAHFHNIFSQVGDVGMILFLGTLFLIFPGQKNKNFRLYLCIVFAIGILMLSFFIAAGFLQPPNLFVNYKGLWQRLYVIDFHAMLVVVSIKMIVRIRTIPSRSLSH